MNPLLGRPLVDLERDYNALLDRADELGLDDDLVQRVRQYQRFLGREAHRIGLHPSALTAVACAQADDSPIRASAEDYREARARVGWPWLRLRNPYETDPQAALQRTIHVGSSVNAVVFCTIEGQLHAAQRLLHRF